MKKVKFMTRTQVGQYVKDVSHEAYAEGTKFPVLPLMLHNDGPKVRVLVLVSDTDEVVADVPLDMFNRLPEADLL